VAMAKMFKISKNKKITKETKIYIDSWEEDSCYGRYVNDPLNDHLVNARIVMRGDKMILIALEEIKPGQEIFISYGEEYWEVRQHLLPTTVKGDQTGSKASKK
jgi:SET domain-containing protein